MPKSHKLLLPQRPEQASSQHYPKPEMNFFQPQPLPLAASRQVKFPPSLPARDKDPANLSKNFNSLTLNSPLPGEDLSQQNTKVSGSGDTGEGRLPAARQREDGEWLGRAAPFGSTAHVPRLSPTASARDTQRWPPSA